MIKIDNEDYANPVNSLWLQRGDSIFVELAYVYDGVEKKESGLFPSNKRVCLWEYMFIGSILSYVKLSPKSSTGKLECKPTDDVTL